MIQCSLCNYPNPNGRDTCFRCGAVLHTATPKRPLRHHLLVASLATLSALVFCAVVGFLYWHTLAGRAFVGTWIIVDPPDDVSYADEGMAYMRITRCFRPGEFRVEHADKEEYSAYVDTAHLRLGVLYVDARPGDIAGVKIERMRMLRRLRITYPLQEDGPDALYVVYRRI